MKTIIEKANAMSIQKAADIIKHGGLVAFPTETVYGLGANALDSCAVKKIYSAKGRPSDNPLIVHIGSIKFLKYIVKEIDACTEMLIKEFWPGPLTIIFNKKDCMPYETSGGLETIAVRFPANPTAQKLINLSSVPIAAPSANISGKPSCTSFSHVIEDLDGKVDMILCSNEFAFGLESTIIDMTEKNPTVLRPGAITFEMLKQILGKINDGGFFFENNQSPKAPGMKYKHYSPKADVFIIDGNFKNVANKVNELSLKNRNKKIGVLATNQTQHLYKNCFVISVGDRNNLFTVAENLFSSLRKFDLNQIDIVYSESFPQNDIGFAIMNRLLKAAGYKIIKV